MASKIWRFLDSGKENAFFHMALDEALLNSVRENEGPPVFRLYEWEPSAVTLGYSQKMYDIIDAGRCRRDGIDITRRLTGGRAVFHADEIAYTVIAPVDDPLVGGSILESYRAVSGIFISGFHAAGIPAVMERGAVRTTSGSAARRELPCFMSTARYEITLRGRKLVGSAQLRIGKFFIQQGSIIFGPGHARLADYLLDPPLADACRREFDWGGTGLVAESGETRSRDDIKAALSDAFRIFVGGKAVCDAPDTHEMKQALALQQDKYGEKGWIEGHG